MESKKSLKKKAALLSQMLINVSLKFNELEQDNLILQQENENLKQTVNRLAKGQK